MKLALTICLTFFLIFSEKYYVRWVDLQNQRKKTEVASQLLDAMRRDEPPPDQPTAIHPTLDELRHGRLDTP